MKRVLVTGGFGFQGSHLVMALLDRGDHVTVLSTPSARNQQKVTLVRERMARVATPSENLIAVAGSVADAEILEKTIPGHDAVVHMAAWTSVDVSLDRPWPPFEINAQGTLSVLEACRRFADPKCRLVVASSCEVYGPTRPIEGHVYEHQNESWPLLPRSPYAASKIAADRYAYAHAVTFGMDVVILRPCNVYGPGQRSGSLGAVIPTFVRAAATGAPLVVTGGGDQFREFLYVEDLVEAYLLVLDAEDVVPGATYNVGSGETCTVYELAKLIRKTVNQAAEIQHSAARVADVSGFRLDSTKFMTGYGWKPKVELAAGLARYVAWARSVGGLV